jgi:hypothetical protein
MHGSLPVVIEHKVGHDQNFGAKASRKGVDVWRAESQGEDSVSQGEVLKTQVRRICDVYRTRIEAGIVVLGDLLYFGVIWEWGYRQTSSVPTASTYLTYLFTKNGMPSYLLHSLGINPSVAC